MGRVVYSFKRMSLGRSRIKVFPKRLIEPPKTWRVWHVAWIPQYINDLIKKVVSDAEISVMLMLFWFKTSIFKWPWLDICVLWAMKCMGCDGEMGSWLANRLPLLQARMCGSPFSCDELYNLGLVVYVALGAQSPFKTVALSYHIWKPFCKWNFP